MGQDSSIRQLQPTPGDPAGHGSPRPAGGGLPRPEGGWAPTQSLRVAGQQDTGLAPNQKEDTGLGLQGFDANTVHTWHRCPLGCRSPGHALVRPGHCKQCSGIWGVPRTPHWTNQASVPCSSLVPAVLRNFWTSAWVAPKSVPRIAPGLVLRGCSLIRAQGSSCASVQRLLQAQYTGMLPALSLKDTPASVSAQGYSGTSAEISP